MLSSTALAAFAVLALLALASVRRIPADHVYALRRMDGHMRFVGAGTHLVMPLVERVAHKISLAGATLGIDDLQLDGVAHRAVVYFQVLDPQRADTVIQDIERLLRSAAARLAADPELPHSAPARRQWFKQALNTGLSEHGLLIARVDLTAFD